MVSTFVAPSFPHTRRQNVARRARRRLISETPICRANSAASIPRRALLRTAALAMLSMPALAVSADAPVASTADAEVTDRVYLDVKVAGELAGRVTVGLFGREAPASVDSFKTAANGGLHGRGGAVAGYRYSAGAKVVRGRYVELGRVKQIDALNQNAGVAQRQTRVILPPENREENALRHDARGVVSVRRGGGSFEFVVALAADEALDDTNIVIGRVLAGEDVLERLAKVPTTKKTIRDGFRNVGRAIGDARAKVDVRNVQSVCA